MHAFRFRLFRVRSPLLAERFWESRPERVKAPYVKADETEQDPEYHETRETLTEGLGSFPFDCPTYLVQSDSR